MGLGRWERGFPVKEVTKAIVPGGRFESLGSKCGAAAVQLDGTDELGLSATSWLV